MIIAALACHAGGFPPDTIQVSGSGTPGFNGTYTRRAGVLSEGVDLWIRLGVADHTSNLHDCIAWKASYGNIWMIFPPVTTGNGYYSQSAGPAGNTKPPTSGWASNGAGVDPPPTVAYLS